MAAAGVAALGLLLWPWGASAGSPPAPIVATTGPTPAAAQPATGDNVPAELIAPDRRQLLATLAGENPAADRVPLVGSYTVSSGDTLSSIAQAFGTDTASLEKINNLDEYSVLHIGQVLTVLRRVGWLYTVKAGDTASSVASANGTTLSALVSVNELVGTNPILQPGERLVIPVEPKVAEPAAPAATASGDGGFIWPVHGIITSPFGWRSDPTGPGSDFHNGLDIAVPTGTHVAAACPGTVILASWDGGYGNAVEIRCSDGLITMYAHNSRLVASVGESVYQGEMISYSGMTGNATGPHVHFGVERDGTWENPLDYLP